VSRRTICSGGMEPGDRHGRWYLHSGAPLLHFIWVAGDLELPLGAGEAHHDHVGMQLLANRLRLRTPGSTGFPRQPASQGRNTRRAGWTITTEMRDIAGPLQQGGTRSHTALLPKSKVQSGAMSCGRGPAPRSAQQPLYVAPAPCCTALRCAGSRARQQTVCGSIATTAHCPTAAAADAVAHITDTDHRSHRIDLDRLNQGSRENSSDLIKGL
jgi:hypothetical protein